MKWKVVTEGPDSRLVARGYDRLRHARDRAKQLNRRARERGFEVRYIAQPESEK